MSSPGSKVPLNFADGSANRSTAIATHEKKKAREAALKAEVQHNLTLLLAETSGLSQGPSAKSCISKGGPSSFPASHWIARLLPAVEHRRCSVWPQAG